MAAAGFGPDDQRVLTQVYLGAVEPRPRPTHTERLEDEAKGDSSAVGKSALWFKDRVATPNGHEYLAV